jgi:type IV pilus assembly protein PilB
MIIVTGPTGSGKTTTLYAVLKKLNKPEVKIITIEDPIEYHLDGISQTQVDPKKGYDFASGLRSMMRQDPDIILVGEIRDLETAQIAIQASLTGHLVLSTLHTNDAAGAIARLQSLGEKAINISPAINMIVGQRLARKVCSKCKLIETASEEEIKKIKKAFNGIPQKILSSILPKNIKEIKKGIKIPKSKGCKFCNNTGYKGRIGIYELLIKEAEIEKLILTSPSIIALKEFAIKGGMIPMRQDGFVKVLEGKTTIEEVERVAGE